MYSIITDITIENGTRIDEHLIFLPVADKISIVQIELKDTAARYETTYSLERYQGTKNCNQ